MSDCIAGSRSDAPIPPTIAQKTMIAVRPWARVMARAPIPSPSNPRTYARLRPIRSPTLLPMRMNAADTSASSAIVDWTPLTVVCRSRTTAEIETFMRDVSTTNTNMAIASKMANRRLGVVTSSARGCAVLLMRDLPHDLHARRSLRLPRFPPVPFLAADAILHGRQPRGEPTHPRRGDAHPHISATPSGWRLAVGGQTDAKVVVRSSQRGRGKVRMYHQGQRVAGCTSAEGWR